MEENEIMESKRVSTKEAARRLGMAECTLRMLMRNKEIDIGYVSKGGKGGGTNHRYWIYEDKLNKCLGKDV